MLHRALSGGVGRTTCKLLSLAALWILPCVLIAAAVVRTGRSTRDAAVRNDFAHYYLSARVLLAGENPYVTQLAPLCRASGLEFDGRISVGANPPLLVRMMATIAWLPRPIAYLIWASLECTSLCVLLVVVRRLLGLDGHDARWLFLIGIILNATCLQRQFLYSQVQVMVAACLAVAVLLHVQNRRVASCAMVALSAAFKIYPAPLIPWFVLTGLQGRRDLVRRCSVVACVGGAVFAVTGVEAWRSFVVDGLPVINRSVGGSVTNYSLPALVSTMADMMWGWPLPGDIAACAKLLGKLLSAGAVIGAYAIVWRYRLDPVAAVGILTAGVMAASLVCWSHYFVLMILPVVWLWREALPPRAHRPRLTPLLAGAFCLWPELDWFVPFRGGVERMALHFYPLAALACVVMLLANSADRRRRVSV